MYDKLDCKLAKLRQWLLDLYSDKKNGWPAVRIDDEIGVLTTSAAIRTFVENESIGYSDICPAVQYILNSQSSYGGWPMIRENNLDAPLATAEAIQALLVVKNKFPHQKIIPNVENSINKAVRWLCNVKNEDGGWSAIIGRKKEVKISSTYVTAIVIIALSLFLKMNNRPKQEITSYIEDAFKCLSERREPNGLWLTFQNSHNADLAICATVAYAYFSYYGDEAKDILDSVSTIGLNGNYSPPILSLPLGWECIQLPDGEVRFYINGAYWACKLFADSHRSYIGYLPLINYLIENNNDYYELTCLVTGFRQEQSVWVSIDMLEIGRKIISLESDIIGNSVIDAAVFISNTVAVRNNHLYVAEAIFGSVNDLATLMANHTNGVNDIKFYEAISYSLALSKIIDENEDLKILMEKYDHCLIGELKKIKSYDEYIQYSTSLDDYAGFTSINRIKVYGVVLNIISLLLNGNAEKALEMLYLCDNISHFVSFEVFYNIMKLILILEKGYNGSETEKKQLIATRNVIQPFFSEEILDKLFSIPCQEQTRDALEFSDRDFEKINIRINTGIPIYNESQFLGRQKELDNACKNILNGVSLAITGDFRIGKTSFLQILSYKLKNELQYLVCNIDFTTPLLTQEKAATKSTSYFVETLTNRIKKLLEENDIKSFRTERVKSTISDIAKKLEEVSIGTISFKQSEKNQNDLLLEEVDRFIKIINDDCLKQDNRYLVIVIDEFNNTSNIEDTYQMIVQVCRMITQKANHMRLVIASQNIFDERKQHGPVPLTTVLTTISLRGFNDEEILRYIKLLNKKIQINTSEITLLKKYTGGSPFWMGLLLNQIINQLNATRTFCISSSIIEESVNIFLQSNDAKNKLNWYYEETTEGNELLKNILFNLSHENWVKKEMLIIKLEKINSLEGNWFEKYMKGINLLILKGVIQEKGQNGQKEFSIINGLFRRWIIDIWGGVE